MTVDTIGTVATGICLLIGSGFIIVGVIGLLKFNDPMTRLHAPTKVGTAGIGMLLLAAMIETATSGDTSYHELLIMAFLFVTAPVSAHFIAKVAIHSQRHDAPPAPPGDEIWSTLDTPESDQKIEAAMQDKAR